MNPKTLWYLVWVIVKIICIVLWEGKAFPERYFLTVASSTPINLPNEVLFKLFSSIYLEMNSSKLVTNYEFSEFLALLILITETIITIYKFKFN